MARMQQPLGIGEDAVQMTILRPVHSLIRTAPHVENLGCERTRVVRWRIHKYLLCLEIGLSQNIFHVLRYFGWCAVISIECGFHRHPFGFPAGLGYVRSGRKDRKSVVEGKSVSVRVDLGGRRIIKKKKTIDKRTNTETKRK